MAHSFPPSPLVTTLLIAPLLFLGGLPAGGAVAKNDDSWKVHEELMGKPDPDRLWNIRDGKDVDKSTDVSGIACEGTGFPRLCILADDESQGVQVVILKDGELEAGEYIHLINDVFNKKPVDFDAEGVAYEDGAFYVVGSHGRPRTDKPEDKAKNDVKAAVSRRIFRIELGRGSVDMKTGRIIAMSNPTGTDELARIIGGHPRLGKWYDTALEDKGMTIEGLAAKDGNFYVGMRGPLLSENKAVVLEVPISMVFDKKPGDVTLHEVDLGTDTEGKPRGIRDIVPHMGGFLILAGPVKNPDNDDQYEIKKGDYTVFSWSGKGDVEGRKYDIEGFGIKVKPEGILPLENKQDNFQALILFDGPVEGRPTPVQIDLK